ncbi:MAG: hypothetical protein H0T20_07915 [Actinobacteria bacterium]|nr:hypothetical protein [Actinomycetota bacterium]
MKTKHDDDSDPVETTKHHDDREPKPLEPEDADEPGFVGGSGGPAAIIFGEDDEAEKHGDRLARGPDESP